jgi:hypothetical protein
MNSIKYKKKGCRVFKDPKTKKSYCVTYWDSILKKSISKNLPTLKKAKEWANVIDFELFSANPELLPKGIHLHTESKRFALGILDPNKSSTITLGYYSTMQDAKEARFRIINSLLNL